MSELRTARSPGKKKGNGNTLSATKQAGVFHHNLMDWTDDLCASVTAWRAETKDINDEAKFCLTQALEMAAARLLRLSQALDDR